MLLENWHSTLEGIADDYTFGDLVALLQEVQDIETMAPLLGCDVAPFLGDADRPQRADDGQPIRYLQVTNVARLSTYERDPSYPDEPLSWLGDEEAGKRDRMDEGIAALTGEPTPRKIVDATEDDSVTGEPLLRRLHVPEAHGTWKPPYVLEREFEGWGAWSEPCEGYFAQHPEVDPARYEGAFALELTPVSALLPLPLRYNPRIRFWSGPFEGVGELLFETEVTITFGEFLRAIFWEIGFHGSPGERDAALEGLRQRAAAVESHRGALLPGRACGSDATRRGVAGVSGVTRCDQLGNGVVMRSRAMRRHQQQRIKRRVARYYGGYAAGDPRATGRLAQTPTPCSCWMCGNPRRHRHEPSLQERRRSSDLEDGRLMSRDVVWHHSECKGSTWNKLLRINPAVQLTHRW